MTVVSLNFSVSIALLRGIKLDVTKCYMRCHVIDPSEQLSSTTTKRGNNNFFSPVMTKPVSSTWYSWSSRCHQRSDDMIRKDLRGGQSWWLARKSGGKADRCLERNWLTEFPKGSSARGVLEIVIPQSHPWREAWISAEAPWAAMVPHHILFCPIISCLQSVSTPAPLIPRNPVGEPLKT